MALTACHSKQYNINGKAEGIANGDTLFLTTDMSNGTPCDTAIVKDGTFSMTGETDSVVFAIIYHARNQDLSAPLFLEEGHISVTFADQPGASRVGGTNINNLYQEHVDSMMVIGKEINRIAEHVYGNTITPEEQQKGMKTIEQLTKRFADMARRQAEENIGNEFGYFLLTNYSTDVFDYQTRSRLIKLMPDNFRQRPAIKQMEQAILRDAKTAEGATISDFSQPGPDGTSVSLLAEVKKHKVTIIDFWASWCGPCRREMPFMVSLYNSYKDKGLGIVGVSLDKDQNAWVQAIKQLNIPWAQMSDLKGWDNAISQHFNVTSIPHTVVIDQQGKILRRGLRGEQLQQYISELLK